MVVPPKHPKMIIFSRKTHGCWGNPPFKETPISVPWIHGVGLPLSAQVESPLEQMQQASVPMQPMSPGELREGHFRRNGWHPNPYHPLGCTRKLGSMASKWVISYL